MNQVIVAIFDRAAVCFSRPVFTQTEGTAIRSFTDEVNRQSPDNQLNVHPEDFDLYHVGVFDDSTGGFMLEDKPRLLIKGIQCLISKE